MLTFCFCSYCTMFMYISILGLHLQYIYVSPPFFWCFIFCCASFLSGHSNYGVVCFLYTSDIKIQSSNDMHAFPTSFGFKGEALSYISYVSLLEIVTKTHWRPNEYRKDGKCWYLGIDDCRQE
ncbi:DNA mismatch repair protein MLH3-like isoform X2 [Solanum dulcamara]|uniref:DNA mismatch repair protein MLH3-like isoform X2 n=1 Tax=Solanum dulcamara TaxID=45834 RepID=UPI0024864B8D|nr:DNA mismatch repair protein MLH3-like isoform X2 [Solanum dulcamara]XP_055803053.1 DNA mismatch repair protein MLH3-like isoform X2 [Solanum dulcamara]